MSNTPSPASTRPAAGSGIRTRKPTGVIPWPLILLEGLEKAGKSLVPVVLSRSARVGMVYWFDLGEGAADEYAALPGSNFEVIEHDGSYRDILDQLTAVWNEADRAARAGEAPVTAVMDSMSAEWTMLVNWTNDRARRSRTGVRKLAEDPDAEIDPTSNLWNDANKRHKRIMDLLMTFPGIAIITARGKEVAVMGANGQPVEGRKEWKVEGQKGLAYDSTAWIRMHRDPREAQLIGVKSLRVQVPERGVFRLPTTKVGSWDVLDLDAFIFDILGCSQASQPRAMRTDLRGDDVADIGDTFSAITGAATEPALQDIWAGVKDRLQGALRDEVAHAVTDQLNLIRAGKASPSVEPNLADHAPNGTEDPDAEALRQAAEEAAAEADKEAAAARAAAARDVDPADDPWAPSAAAAVDRCQEKVGRGRCTQDAVDGSRFCAQHTAERGGEV